MAFVAALQHLPARQRVVLVLREVLRWSAKEVAELLETSVASVNSALQRARETLDELALEDAEAPARPSEEDERRLLEQYLEAFAEYDIDRIVALLRYDVVFDMPPLPLWLRGPEQIGRFMLGQGAGCRGSKLIAADGQRLPGLRRLQARPRLGRVAALVADRARPGAGEAPRAGRRRRTQLPGAVPATRSSIHSGCRPG